MELAQLWRELTPGSADTQTLDAAAVGALLARLPGVDAPIEASDLRALATWVLLRQEPAVGQERELLASLTALVLEAMRPWNGRAEPLMSLIVLLAAALSAVPWIAAKASLRTKVVETLNRIDQLESTGDTSSSGSVADRLCAIAALLSTADTEPLQQAHLVQLLLNSCGAHTAGAADAGPAVSSAGGAPCKSTCTRRSAQRMRWMRDRVAAAGRRSPGRARDGVVRREGGGEPRGCGGGGGGGGPRVLACAAAGCAPPPRRRRLRDRRLPSRCYTALAHSRCW
jgi:hypothetical protein